MQIFGGPPRELGLTGHDRPEHRAQVLDGIGAERPRAAGDGDVEPGGIQEELHAIAGLEALDLPDAVQLLLLLVVLGRQRQRGEAGGGREREGVRGEADGANALLRGERPRDQPPRAAWTADPSAL